MVESSEGSAPHRAGRQRQASEQRQISEQHQGIEQQQAGRRSAGAPELAARLQVAASLLGFTVIVTDDDAWELTESGLRVGLGFYTSRGHPDAEAVALALLQLWESVRAERTAPERTRRHRSIAAHRPELVPLLGAVRRLQAAAELLAALPGLRGDLVAAAQRLLPERLEEQPRHLQWVVLLLRGGLIGDSRTLAGDSRTLIDDSRTLRGGTLAPVESPSSTGRGADPEVLKEWERLVALGGERVDPLRRVLAPDHSRDALQRFERALALLLPPYERLLVLDVSERGLGGDAHGRPGAEDHEAGTDAGDLAPSGSGGENAEEADGDPDREAEAVPPSEDRARPGDGHEAPEGADLFAAEQAGFVRTILPTPMPTEGALIEALIELAGARRPERAAGRGERTGGSAPGSGATASGIADYRARVAALGEPIERMREVWARVIAERVAHRPAPGRRAVPEGESLDRESLARALAEVRAGSPRPSAFLRREARPRRTRRAGSTDYVLLVDRSASMQGPAADAAADAALVMLEALAGAERDASHAEAASRIPLDLDIRTALIVFDAEVDTVKPLSRGLDDGVRKRMHTEIRSPRGSTNDGGALRAAAEQLGLRHPETPSGPGFPPVEAGGGVPADRAGAGIPSVGDGVERRRIVILVGDGGSNDPVAAEMALRRLHAAGVRVYGIGIGSDEIVERFAPTSVRVDDPRRIADALQDLIERELP